MTKTKPSLLNSILAAGLLAGILDISAAILQHYLGGGKNPLNILRFIASGIFGKAAFDGSYAMAIWGLLFHFAIAIIFTAAFFVWYPRLRKISTNTIVLGVFYGIVIWLLMNLLVLPLSRTPALTFKVTGALTGIFILIVAVGIPVSVLAYRYYSKVKQTKSR